MMKRFSRKRRGDGGTKTTTIDASEWLPKIAEQGIVETESLEPWAEAGVPDTVAAIGKGARSDGSAVIVAFSPASATEAMIGGLAAAQQAAEAESFAGELLIVAPQWPAGARRVLGLIGRTPYTVEPVPDHMAPKYTSGRYVGPPQNSTRPGIYWVNTYALESRPLYNLAALTLHEAVPGHHMQNALAREQGEQPNFRRFSYLSAFGEGWGLYCEFLGIEMDMYETPYDHFGRMTYEMWRAVRLVVDTGMHAKGWTRQQTLDYLAENTALPLHEIKTETDRYISWPGQALAYKMGEIKIRELRTKAEEALGRSFDIRAFHDAVLEGGSVPLPILEQQIDRFIARSKEKAAEGGDVEAAA